ncbi:zinc ribbon domain-containing protein [Streptomyces sp. NPDC046985]|uniref:NADase-type glycan-binding domain-containing protein n=1 Tax=Streptomyces sp. NPDC046985 TaxID=3155377 RepID=UPI0033C68DE2
MTTSQNCAECGARAEPGQSFCDACGAVLGWKDRAAAAAASPAAGTTARTGADAPARVSAQASARTSGSRPQARAASADATPAAARTGRTAGAGDPGEAGAAGRGQDGDASRTAPAAAGEATGRAVGKATGGTSHARKAPGASDAPDSSGSSGSSGSSDAPDASGSANGGDGHGGWAATSSGTAPDPAAPASRTPHAGRTGDPASTPDDQRQAARALSETAPTAPLSPAERAVPLSPAERATPPSPAAPAAPGSGGDAGDDGLTDRARRLLVPVADPEARPDAPRSVEPVLPGLPEHRRPQTVRAPGEELGAHGGTPCPWCATPNRPERHFCARCAMPMAGDGPVAGRLPWWRRLRWFGAQETPWAGDRPRLRRVFDRVLGWLGAALALGLLVYLVVHIPQGVQATRDHFAKRSPVAPDSYGASRSFPGHRPQLAFDELNNTWWGPGVSESAQGQWIEARFAEPTRLLDLLITPGESTRPDQLSKSALPHRVEVRVTGANGKTTTRELNLDQGAGAQRVPFRVGEVTAVRFTLKSAYLPAPTKQVAIAEIEFFGPSHAS